MKDVKSQVSSDELEREVLAYWDTENIFEKSLERSKDRPVFTFYDGPPYATGKPHYGHVLQSAIKDTVLRFKAMRGYHVPRRVGWDTHGLPVEVLVEKELGLKTKQDVLELGIEKFNEACRNTVFRYIDEFTGTLKRLGRWADYDNAYSTMTRDYMESEWWVFQQLWDQGLVYKDFRSTPYCTRCGTPLSTWELSMAYRDKHDLAVYVFFPVDEGASLLVWTTTPWTLPANVAVAISRDVDYVSVRHDGREVVVAKDRVADIFGDDVEIVKDWKADELLELKYEPLFEYSGEVDVSNAYRVVVGDHVTADDGSGLVHMAPAFGQEDAEVGKKEGLPLLRTVDTAGKFTGEAGEWKGQHIFDANKQIAKNLEERGLLLKQEHYKHSYPHCWRCDTPLIYYALDTWFIRVTEIKEQMLENNKQIDWTPEHVKEGRFGKGLETAPDWAVSRNRFWSTPIPVWECDSCDERVCIGSIEELRKKSGIDDIQDIHRPYIDAVTFDCSSCSGTMQRIEEVLDVWFDSGSMPYSQWHYPFENKEFVENSYPADFISEAIEMTRAWFFFLHVIATAVMKKPAFRAAIASGLIFAEDGNKLSKKLKNYPDIEPTLEKYGADVLRFYLLSSSTLGEPYRFSEKDMRQVQRNVYMTLWNVYSFYVRYNLTRSHNTPSNSLTVLDRWILARLKQVHGEVVAASDKYQVDASARKMVGFVDDLSNWYVRRSRSRFQATGADEAAFETLYYVLVEFSKLMAPYMPFVSEEMYRNLTGKESVHFEQLSDAEDLTSEEEQLLRTMKQVRDVVSEGMALRAEAGIKVRQPLQTLRVALSDDSVELENYADVIADEVNVKTVEFVVPTPSASQTGGENNVSLDTELTEELRYEGMARDIIRHGQVLRRKAGYALDDRITLVLDVEANHLTAMWDYTKESVLHALQVDDVVTRGESDEEAELRLGDAKVVIGVKKS